MKRHKDVTGKYIWAFGPVMDALPDGFAPDWLQTFHDSETEVDYDTWGIDDIDRIPEHAQDAREQAVRYWTGVVADIEAAKAHESKAKELLARGEYEEAVAEIQAAVDLEQKHNDAGTYEHVLNQLPVALDTSESAHEPSLLCVSCALDVDGDEVATYDGEWIIAGDNEWGMSMSVSAECAHCGCDLSDVLTLI